MKFLEADDYAKKILGEKNNNNKEDKDIKNIKHIDLIDENATNWNVAQIADIHTDLNYQEGSLGNCIDPICCQSVSKGESQKESNGYNTFSNNDNKEKENFSTLKFLGKIKLLTFQ